MALPILFSNNATSTLAAAVAAVDTSFSVAAGEGSRFPNPAPGQYFVLTLTDTAGNMEFVRVDARSGDSMTTVQRGYWGTTARNWAAGDSVKLLWTAEAISLLYDTISSEREATLAAGTTADVTNADTIPKKWAGNQLKQAIIDNAPSGGAVSWGGISGTLSNQTDLQAALNGKLADAAAVIKDTHIDWGTGAGQVSHDDIPDGASYVRYPVADRDKVALAIPSDTAQASGSSQVTNIVALTTAQYNALTPNANTLYLITDAV